MQSGGSWKNKPMSVPHYTATLSEPPGQPAVLTKGDKMQPHGWLEIRFLSVAHRLLRGPLPLQERLLWLLVSLYVASL